jgi:hypothetical protein
MRKHPALLLVATCAVMMICAASSSGGGHDEPIVVDNGPTRVTFGSDHTAAQLGKEWRREFTALNHVVVTLIDHQDRTLPSRTRKLCQDCSLRFDLRSADGHTNVLTFTPDVLGRVVSMSLATGPMARDTDGRITPDRDYRIQAIRGTDRNRDAFEMDLSDGGRGYKKIIVTLSPISESDRVTDEDHTH